MRRCIVLMLALLLAAPSSAGAADDATRLDALANRYWKYELATSYAMQMQARVPIRRLRAPSLQAAQEDGRFGASVLRELSAINAGRLDHERWLTYRALQYDAQGLLGDAKYYWYGQQITPYGQQFPYMLPIFASYRFASAADGKPYIALLRDVAQYTRVLQTLAAGQHARGIILPDVETSAAVATLSAYAAPAGRNPFMVQANRLKALPSADAAALQRDIRAELESGLLPALHTLIAYLNGPYRHGAPSGVGQSQYPGGRAYYAYMVSRSTTLDLTTQQIHAIGLREVARLNREIDAVRREMGYKGNLAAFRSYLKSDPHFFATSGSEIGNRLEGFVERAARKIPAYYDRLPRAPYGVAPLPANLAGAQTFGYYDRPTPETPRGTYRYNGSHPQGTWLPESGAIIMHELIPGHHFQIALQQENTALPPVRRYDMSVTAFVEGYAEYASQLGFEMGMYRDPYDRIGRLMLDMMISCRLVVDTGMNDMGWSLERARHYLRENTIMADNQIATETLRYSTDLPAQALAYKLGELTMLQLRDEAKTRMGPHFDIRAFHRWLIGSGTMTLATLREHLRYEEKQSAGN